MTALGEGDLARKHVSDARPNMVVHAEIGARRKSHFGGAQFELAVDFGQMPEDNLFELDLRGDAASCAARRPPPPSSAKSNTSIKRMFVLLPGQDRTRHGSGLHRDAERAWTNRAGSKLAG
jgi:hypothetical protein